MIQIHIFFVKDGSQYWGESAHVLAKNGKILRLVLYAYNWKVDHLYYLYQIVRFLARAFGFGLGEVVFAGDPTSLTCHNIYLLVTNQVMTVIVCVISWNPLGYVGTIKVVYHICQRNYFEIKIQGLILIGVQFLLAVCKFWDQLDS